MSGTSRAKPRLATEIEPLRDQGDVIYRGISAEEYERIVSTGKVQSRGEYNLTGQEGLTYWTTDPRTAEAYANGFAPWQFKPTFTKPAYVIAMKRPAAADIRNVQGTGENEVGVARSADVGELVAIWRGDVYSHRPASVLLSQSEYGDSPVYKQGGGTMPSSDVVWSRVDGRKRGGLDALFDAARKRAQPRGKGGRFRTYAKGPSQRRRSEIEAAERRLSRLNYVNVQTAEDDRVCETCLSLAENSPYTIDRAWGGRSTRGRKHL